jgi:hypothetical protein
VSLDEQQRLHTFALVASLQVIGFGLGAVLSTLGFTSARGGSGTSWSR